jgi:hypothetical protein
MTDGETKFHALLGRALTDHDFRDALLDPSTRVEALESMGIEATHDVLHAVDDAVEALTRLATDETLGDVNAVA